MKKLLLSAIALAAMTASALAADLPSRKAAPAYVPPPPPPPMWTGFYAGLNIGGGWNAGNGNSNAWNLDGMNGGVTNNIGGSNGSGGVIGGGQIGYNYQLNGLGGGIGGMGLLVGAEADFQGTSMGSSGGGSRYGYLLNMNNGTTAYVPGWVGGGVSVPWFGTVRGRLGLTVMPTLLIYGTGGFAYADVQRNGGWNNNSATQTGWTAGGGAEWMFMPNWSAKAEYLYTDVSGGNTNTWNNWGASLNNVNNHTRWNTVRAGVNYHFNWGGAPSVAKY